MNLWDILILAAVGCCLFFALRRLGKKKGCSCGCSDCHCCNKGK